jgi:hypothetical protein
VLSFTSANKIAVIKNGMLVRDFNLGCSNGMSKAKGPNVDSGFQPSGSKVA